MGWDDLSMLYQQWMKAHSTKPWMDGQIFALSIELVAFPCVSHCWSRLAMQRRELPKEICHHGWPCGTSTLDSDTRIWWFEQWVEKSEREREWQKLVQIWDVFSRQKKKSVNGVREKNRSICACLPRSKLHLASRFSTCEYLEVGLVDILPRFFANPMYDHRYTKRYKSLFFPGASLCEHMDVYQYRGIIGLLEVNLCSLCSKKRGPTTGLSAIMP